LLAIVLLAANELNDFCAQENPSHTAIATRPASASDIRYAVRPASPQSTKSAIAGLDPAIHLENAFRRLMDARIKSGHDEKWP
jgi:hypothetical protein